MVRGIVRRSRSPPWAAGLACVVPRQQFPTGARQFHINGYGCTARSPPISPTYRLPRSGNCRPVIGDGGTRCRRPGTWEAVLEIGGKKRYAGLCTVTTDPVSPIDHPGRRPSFSTSAPRRSTFGSVAKNGAAPQQTFTINNHGYTALTTSNLVLPAGFSLVGSFPSSIDP